MKKILEVIPNLGTGGAERFVVDLCNEFSTKEDVILVLLFSDGHFYLPELSNKVKVITLNKKLGFDWRIIFKLRAIFLHEKPDVVHSHVLAFSYTFLAILLLFKRIKFLHTIHSDAYRESGGGFLLKLKKFAFSSKRCIPITISEESQTSFWNTYRLNSYLIYNGRNSYEKSIGNEFQIEFSKYRITNKTKVLVNVASIYPVKNQTMLCDAVNQLSEEGYDIVLLIIGRKANQNFYEEVLKRKTDRIHLLGERHNPRDYMAESDIFCLTSIVEAMPISLIEAFSTGCIPVCTPVGGIINMIQNGINGFLAMEVTVESYIEALKNALDLNENDMMEMKRQSLLSFSYYSMEKCANSYLDLMFYENE